MAVEIPPLPGLWQDLNAAAVSVGRNLVRLAVTWQLGWGRGPMAPLGKS